MFNAHLYGYVREINSKKFYNIYIPSLFSAYIRITSLYALYTYSMCICMDRKNFGIFVIFF